MFIFLPWGLPKNGLKAVPPIEGNCGFANGDSQLGFVATDVGALAQGLIN